MNDCFDKIRGGNCTLYIHRNFRNDTFEQALLDGEKKLGGRYQLTTIQSSKFARIYKFTARFDKEDRVVYFKQYLRRSAWDFIKDFVRASRAERAFKASEVLAENGFDAPAIIAMGKSKHGLAAANFMVTLEAKDAKEIYKFLYDSKLRTEVRRELVRALGQTIGKMHAKGIFHGDLRVGNILAKREKDHWKFFFLDNERTRKFGYLPTRLRLKNLVQLNMFRAKPISNTDRMRFFREYWAQNNKGGFEKESLIKKVLKKTDRRLEKKIKSGR